MATHIALLRGINVGAHNRIPMERLREVLEEHGYENVRTLLQSGNVLLDSPDAESKVAMQVGHLIQGEFGLKVPVVTRSAKEIARIYDADPLADVATSPKAYQVIFCAKPPRASALADVDPDGYGNETYHVVGKEIYTWTPDGIHTSRLLRDLADEKIGTTGTARNWDTVRKLRDMSQR